MYFQGNGVSKGLAIGPVYRYEPFVPDVKEKKIQPSSIKETIEIYQLARNCAGNELDVLQRHLEEQEAEEAKIFCAHRDILFDVAMEEEIIDAITYDYMDAEYAVETTFVRFAELLNRSDNPLIRERIADMQDVKNRLLRCLAGIPEASLDNLEQPVVLVAQDLLPSDTASLDRTKVLAIVTALGGATSHSAIIARSYEIPAVQGIAGAPEVFSDGEMVIVDALTGIVITESTAEELSEYLDRQVEYQKRVEITREFRSRIPVTTDGVKLDVELNIGSANEEELSSASVADGVGLFRTEFLYMGRTTLPDENEQYEKYKKVVETFGDRPMILRTLDIGGDKPLMCMDLPKEDNPFLGNRAIRLCFSNEELFLTQLRAVLRASAHGNLWVMFPMVGSLDDIRRAKALLNRAKTQLDAKGMAYNPNIQVGAMIEIPALAIMAEEVALEVDFASIGTNDLTQYTLAVDRGEPAVTQYYQTYHPAVFRLIAMVSRAFEKAGKPLGVCGEMGGDPLGAAVLMGLGIRCLSMGGASIAVIKRMICGLSITEAQEIAENSCKLPTADEVERMLKEKLAHLL